MSDAGTVTVRDAAPADAGGIAHVHVRSWQETYAGVLDERFFSDAALARRAQFWSGYLATQPRPGRMSVAERDETVIGFANAGDAVGPDAEHGFAVARPLHLFSIYVLAADHGTGAGQALLEAVIGAEAAQLWVLRGNARAIAFYRRNGFDFDGARFTDPRDPAMVELRMVR